MKQKQHSRIIDPKKFGVSFSVKQCRSFGINAHDCLLWLCETAGFRRFRLMSYWNEIEKEQGKYDFSELDRQIKTITTYSGVITLCLGVKQPSWPEYHWPTWAKNLPNHEKTTALLQFTETIVKRYKDNPAIISWQLENEALLKGFGENIHIDRKRLRTEFILVKKLDPTRPVIMSTSNGWGIPLRRPIPDLVGFSYYLIINKNGRYYPTMQKPWLYRLRKTLIHTLLRRTVFIHELQLEPWGPTAIWKKSAQEQDKSMSPQQIRKNLEAAQKIDAYPIDLWGGEWWYWRSTTDKDTSIFDTVSSIITQ